MGNSSKEFLKGRDIGVYFGTFSPLHTGHQRIIEQAKNSHDGVIVVTSGYLGDRGDLIGLGLDKRYNYLEEAYRNEPNVHVEKLDETDLPKYPHGWDVWTSKLLDILENAVEDSLCKFTFYVGEEEYVENLKARMSLRNDVVLVSRETVQISATEIRENPAKQWNHICPSFRKHFRKSILVLGENNSFTKNIITKLSEHFDATMSGDYLENYLKETKISISDFKKEDFLDVLTGQTVQTANLLQDNDSNFLIFSENNPLSLVDIFEPYLPDENIVSIVGKSIALFMEEDWDLTIVIAENNEEYQRYKNNPRYKDVSKNVILFLKDSKQTESQNFDVIFEEMKMFNSERYYPS